MRRSDSGREDVPALDRDVRGEREKRGADQTQGPSLAIGTAGAPELPHHNDRGADLHERVQAESGECNRVRSEGREGKEDDPNDVPTQGDVLKGQSPLQQPSGTDRHVDQSVTASVRASQLEDGPVLVGTVRRDRCRSRALLDVEAD